MPKDLKPSKPTTRRYSEEEKAQAMRLVRQLRRADIVDVTFVNIAP